MAFLSVPTRRGSLFQSDKSATRIFAQKAAERTEEYNKRHTRKSTADDEEHVVLNIGGAIFKTRKKTLRNVPSTRLAKLDEHDAHFDCKTGEYFFDRNPFMFSFILDYYRSGTMHLPRGVCSILIKDEMKFWNLEDGCISECCRKYYFDELDSYMTYEMIKREFYALPTYTEKQRSSDDFKSRLNEFRRRAWVFIDNHESSLAAKVFATVYYGLVILTILSMFFSTLPSLRVPLRKHVLIRTDDDGMPNTPNFTESMSVSMKYLVTTEAPDFLTILDMICLFFFTLEFIFRLLVCPSIVDRFKSWYTLLDILYLVPAWTRFIFDTACPFFWQRSVKNMTLLFFLDAMMVFRVFRIFRLSRHYRGLRVLLLAIKASVSELMLLVVFVLFALTIFASFVYCAEQYSPDTEYTSIFIGLWWSLITLTTVGYGDFFPVTTVGYLIACVCAITGLLIIGMVVPIIAGNFHLYYGFRHAGCEDIVLQKPEFVPSENENPAPDLDFQTYKPKLPKSIPEISRERLIMSQYLQRYMEEQQEHDAISPISSGSSHDSEIRVAPLITTASYSHEPEFRHSDVRAHSSNTT